MGADFFFAVAKMQRGWESGGESKLVINLFTSEAFLKRGKELRAPLQPHKLRKGSERTLSLSVLRGTEVKINFLSTIYFP